MSMKLSYRDKVIIIVVAVLVVLGVGIFCFVKPKITELQGSEDRLASKQAEEQQVKDKMGTLESLKKTLEEDVKDVEDSQKQFLSEKEYGETFQISKYLMEKLEAIDMTITGVEMEPLVATALNEYTYIKNGLAYPLKINADIGGELPEEVMNAYNDTYPEAAPSATLAGTVVTVSYTCDDAAPVFESIQKIADSEENIYLITCESGYGAPKAEADGTIPQVEGSMTIAVYEIYPMDPKAIDKE